MRGLTVAAAAMALMLGGCGENGVGGNSQGAAIAPVKRLAGSWTQKIEVVRFEAKDQKADAKAQLQQMFDMMSGMSVCLTPDAVAKEDINKNIEQLGAGGGDCTFDKRFVSGTTVDIAGVCKSASGGTAKIAAKGSTGPSAQDISITVEGITAAGTSEGVMEMRVRSNRTGECKPGDITPPPAPAPAATKGGEAQ